MEEPLPAPVNDLLDESDPLRLIIRAHSAIEKYVAMALQSRFLDQKWPADLGGMSFRQRLALAVALGLVPADVKPLINEFSNLRNDIARGKLDEVGERQAKKVFALCQPYLSDDAPRWLAGAEPISYLHVAVATIYVLLTDSVRLAEDERRFAERAVTDARRAAMKRASLSADQIRELLADEEEDE
jgi:hypothetical protein